VQAIENKQLQNTFGYSMILLKKAGHQNLLNDHAKAAKAAFPWQEQWTTIVPVSCRVVELYRFSFCNY